MRHPASLDRNERWKLIAADVPAQARRFSMHFPLVEVPGKTKAQCVERFKFLREQLSKAGASRPSDAANRTMRSCKVLQGQELRQSCKSQEADSEDKLCQLHREQNALQQILCTHGSVRSTQHLVLSVFSCVCIFAARYPIMSIGQDALGVSVDVEVHAMQAQCQLMPYILLP